jgi:peptide/nickel transport system substrate-binding protein
MPLSLPSRRELADAFASLKGRERWLAASLLFLAAVALLAIIIEINFLVSEPVPATGGFLNEGIIGTPRFINPLLAASDADRNLSALIYSGLLRVAADGSLLPDLAESYNASADGLAYTFTLKPNLVWPDGEPLTTADVEFTINQALNPQLKSSRRASWEGVKLTVVNEREIRFELKQPYPSFLENATMGILPRHLWQEFDQATFALSRYNTEAVGSGPYQVSAIKTDDTGVPVYYDLVPFKKFALGPAKISRLRLYFYPTETELLNAYERGEIEAAVALSAESATALAGGGAPVASQPLPRVFGVFFNQNRAPVLANLEVRQALDLALDKQKIIDEVLGGYGEVANGPIPWLEKTASSTPGADLAGAKKLLTAKGWTLNAQNLWTKKTKTATTTLAFTLATSDTPELKHAAELIKAAWETLGAQVELKIFSLGDLNQNVIRPRQYDALFFGEVLGRHPDLFPFWDSSQRLDPGLNIALYTNSAVDKLLAAARTATSTASLRETEIKLEDLIAADTPAVFVYAPHFLYLLPTKVRGVSLPPLNTPADSFLAVHQWYTETDRVWKVFN